MMIAAKTHDPDQPRKALHQAMVTLLTLGAIDAERIDPDRSLEITPDHPGYLHRTVSGERVYVPFHLAKVSPRSDILKEVISIGRLIRLKDGNPLCISGSTTFLGAVSAVADLDYCEYYLLPADEAAAGLCRVSSLRDLPLIQVKFANLAHSAPWSCLVNVGEAFEAVPDRLKLDFMSCGPLGPMPTTSVVLPTQSGEDYAAMHSFAYQEALIGADAPIRVLIRPDRFGAYLRFLKEQAREYVDGSAKVPQYAIKALKRILALKAALGDLDDVEAIVAKLNQPGIEEVVKRVRLDELREMEPHLPSGTPKRFSRQIKELEEGASQVTSNDVAETLAAARELAGALLEQTERDFAEYV